jgi:hypothetical protein
MVTYFDCIGAGVPFCHYPTNNQNAYDLVDIPANFDLLKWHHEECEKIFLNSYIRDLPPDVCDGNSLTPISNELFAITSMWW